MFMQNLRNLFAQGYFVPKGYQHWEIQSLGPPNSAEKPFEPRPGTPEVDAFYAQFRDVAWMKPMFCAELEGHRQFHAFQRMKGMAAGLKTGFQPIAIRASLTLKHNQKLRKKLKVAGNDLVLKKTFFHESVPVYMISSPKNWQKAWDWVQEHEASHDFGAFKAHRTTYFGQSAYLEALLPDKASAFTGYGGWWEVFQDFMYFTDKAMYVGMCGLLGITPQLKPDFFMD